VKNVVFYILLMIELKNWSNNCSDKLPMLVIIPTSDYGWFYCSTDTSNGRRFWCYTNTTLTYVIILILI